MTWQRYTKTIECSASDHVTPENRTRVLDWVLAWGGHGALTPDGAEDLLVLYTDRGEWPVREGARVVYNGTYFYPSEPGFDDGWSALAGGTEAGSAPLLDRPAS